MARGEIIVLNQSLKKFQESSKELDFKEKMTVNHLIVETRFTSQGPVKRTRIVQYSSDGFDEYSVHVEEKTLLMLIL